MQPTLIYQQLSTAITAEPRAVGPAVPPRPARLRPAVARALYALARRIEPAPSAEPVVVFRAPRPKGRVAGPVIRRPACSEPRRVRVSGRPRRGGPP